MRLNLEWAHPSGLWALALPVVLALLSLRRGKPSSLHLGTLRLWRNLTGESEGARIRRHIPLARVLLIGALVAGALALAGPRQKDPPTQTTWHVVLDTRPAMFMEHTTSDGKPSGQGTRLAVGLSALERLLQQQDERPDLRWSRRVSGVTRLDRVPGERVPDAFVVSGPPGHERSSWLALDEPHTLWVSDSMPPGSHPEHAGYVLSGGGPVPGPVASVGDRLLSVRGGEWVEETGSPTRSVLLSDGLPALLESFVGVWAKERGLGVSVSDPGDDTLALRIVAAQAGEATARVGHFGRDGWQASALMVLVGEESAAAPRARHWLSADVGGASWPLVSWRPGWVRVAFGDPFEDRSGDPGAFAVSWGDLLDSALLPAPNVRPQSEREAAGPAITRAPRSASFNPVAAPGAWPLVRWLSAIAGVLLFASALTLKGNLNA
ncbi:MAG TPA: hypothetical protein EYQ74_07025 [Planctomycetes bacterium]|nr:hypothetical protein [Planctomycetota bacterium]HIK59484.1 hypothetical protein [Planctomycetota bacterium]